MIQEPLDPSRWPATSALLEAASIHEAWRDRGRVLDAVNDLLLVAARERDRMLAERRMTWWQRMKHAFLRWLHGR